MKHTALIAYIGAVVFCAAAAALAPKGGGDFDLSWHTIDGGGGTSIGGDFELSGTIGQPDASAAMTGGAFGLVGGFWSFTAAPTPPCPADLDGDGSVNVTDLLVLLGAWGTPDGDVTGDGLTDVADLLEVLAAWGPCP